MTVISSPLTSISVSVAKAFAADCASGGTPSALFPFHFPSSRTDPSCPHADTPSANSAGATRRIIGGEANRFPLPERIARRGDLGRPERGQDGGGEALDGVVLVHAREASEPFCQELTRLRVALHPVLEPERRGAKLDEARLDRDDVVEPG